MVRVFAAVAVLALLVSWGGVSRAEDKIIGAVWELRVKMPGKESYESKGFLRCTTDGKVYRDGKVVGSHKNLSWEDVEVKIDGLTPEWNGVSKAKRVEKDGKIWEGVHKNEKGEEIPIRLFLKKD